MKTIKTINIYINKSVGECQPQLTNSADILQVLPRAPRPCLQGLHKDLKSWHQFNLRGDDDVPEAGATVEKDLLLLIWPFFIDGPHHIPLFCQI